MKLDLLLTLLTLCLSAAAAASAEDSLNVPLRVTKLEGHFNTYSIPGEGKNARWHGFFVYEEIEGPILGVFVFEE